jgi:parallel beta-helix repeat protein
MANGGNGISGQGHITHNTVVANNGAGCAPGDGAPEIAGNIFAGNIVGVSRTPTAAALRDNCVWGNTVANYEGMADPTGREGNIALDPQFANPMVGNYHLQPGSPCVDAADAGAPATALDIDLRPRLIGAATDMGAAESDGRVWRYLSHVVRVSPTGNDDNDGSTWPSAKRTVQAALIDAADGGEIWVAAGTYSNAGGFVLPPFVSMYGGFAGTESSRSGRDAKANVTTLSRPNAGYILTASAGNRVSVVDGFTLAPTSAFRAIGGIQCNGASPIVQHNTLRDLVGDPNHGLIGGMNAAPLIVDNTVSGNVMNNSGTGLLFFTSGSAPDIERNTFSDNGIAEGYNSSIIGVKVSRRIIIRDNVFVRNSPGDGYGWMDALQVDALEVVGNTFVSNSGSFGSLGVTSFIEFANNIFSGCPGAPPTGGTNICYFQSGDASGSVGHDGNIGADPMFVDPAHDDYRLKPGSPCINAGTNNVVRAGEWDLDGGPRIQQATADIGAYEARPAMTPLAAARLALCIAAGIQAPTPSDVSLLDKDGQPGIGLGDAAWLLRAGNG